MASMRELRDEIKEGLQETQQKSWGLNSKRRALMTAVRGNDLAKVERLLNQGVDPNFSDRSGESPLHIACLPNADESGKTSKALVEMLLFMGANPEIHNMIGSFPLHLAAAYNPPVVQPLLEKGCHIDAQNNAGCTALMDACRYNYTDPIATITQLLHYNANIHLADEEGLTALHCVCANRFVEAEVRSQMAVLLLTAGLSATFPDRQGRMALCHELKPLVARSYRVLPSESLQMVETLLRAGSTLQPSSPAHLYWVRYCLNTSCPKVLSRLLEVASPVLSRRSVRMIDSAVREYYGDDEREDQESTMLKRQTHRLLCSLDTLQAICRTHIRANLRGKLMARVPLLPLPNRLKNYLTSLDLKPA